MRQKNERNIDLIHSSRTRTGEGGKKRNINFPLKDLNLRPWNFLRSEVHPHSYRFLVNEP